MDFLPRSGKDASIKTGVEMEPAGDPFVDLADFFQSLTG
jgi:hypothetical protein